MKIYEWCILQGGLTIHANKSGRECYKHFKPKASASSAKIFNVQKEKRKM